MTSVHRTLEQWPSGRVPMKWILYPELLSAARLKGRDCLPGLAVMPEAIQYVEECQ